jgi:ribosomal protein L37E
MSNETEEQTCEECGSDAAHEPHMLCEDCGDQWASRKGLF